MRRRSLAATCVPRSRLQTLGQTGTGSALTKWRLLACCVHEGSGCKCRVCCTSGKRGCWQRCGRVRGGRARHDSTTVRRPLQPAVERFCGAALSTPRPPPRGLCDFLIKRRITQITRGGRRKAFCNFTPALCRLCLRLDSSCSLILSDGVSCRASKSVRKFRRKRRNLVFARQVLRVAWASLANGLLRSQEREMENVFFLTCNLFCVSME